MIRIDEQPFSAMKAHAEATYPDECVGVMFGSLTDGVKEVSESAELANAHEGSQRARYELRPEDLLKAEKEARARKLDVIGIYHSHPDADAYFSETDLKNSCPWFSFVVLSIKQGKFDHANSWLPDADQTKADKEELTYGD